MNLQERINAFIALGKDLEDIFINKKVVKGFCLEDFWEIAKTNEWFTKESIEFAIAGWIENLKKQNIEKWLSPYSNISNTQKKKVGIVTAGNIPLVGFHDLLCVLISGHQLLVKISSKDEKLMKILISLLIKINDGFNDLLFLEKGQLKNFDAIIATGSDNTAKYFEYYFGKYPNIIRKNRNSVALLTGNETDADMEGLASDVMTYFGLGCRNVSKLYLPQNFDIQKIFKALFAYQYYKDHNKFANNYTYNKSIFLMNKVPFWENGFVILTENESLASPISVIHIEYYKDIETIKNRIKIDKNSIQCIVSKKDVFENSIDFGKAQKPDLWDYADDVDTMKFLLEI